MALKSDCIKSQMSSRIANREGSFGPKEATHNIGVRRIIDGSSSNSTPLEYRAIAPRTSKPAPAVKLILDLENNKTTEVKRKNTLPLARKFEIIMYKEENPKIRFPQLAEKFDVSYGTLRNFFRPERRKEIIEAMKNPDLAKMKKCMKTTKWCKKKLKRNLPLSYEEHDQIKEEEERKIQKKEAKPRSKTCIRNGRKRITLAEKGKLIQRWEEEKAKDPEITPFAVAKMVDLNGGSLRTIIKLADEIKRALLLPETADMISIPREEKLRQMFDDAGLDFPPLPEKEPEPEGPPDFLLTLSAGDIAEVVTEALSHCEFDQIAHAQFVMNLREMIETTNCIVIPQDLPKFIPWRPTTVKETGEFLLTSIFVIKYLNSQMFITKIITRYQFRRR